ncbi:MAG TPA: aminopeptidase N [Egibacteraceae bacterium]
MSAANLTRAEARARADLLGDVAYRVDLDLTRGDATFTSDTTVTFSCRRPGASTFIDLDAETVHRVELNGVALGDDAVHGQRVRLPELAAANELRIVADCRYSRTGVGLHRFTDPVDGSVYLHTQFEPFEAHRVYACFDQPDLKAPFTLTVRAPAEWQVVSNTAAESTADDGDGARRWSFPATQPLSPYVTALVAGPFSVVRDRHGDLDLGVWCRASLAPYLDADEIFEVTKQGFDFFTEAFDHDYPFSHKYDQLFVPEFNWGAMENVGCVTFSESYVFRSKVTEAARESRASTILHEMAHMWFGDLVTMRWWDDLWLNESFATYMGTLALAEATRFRTAWSSFANARKAWAYNQDQLPTTHPIVADIVDIDATRTHFDGITYAKGAAVLKQLVAWVGRDAFRSGLAAYFRRHAYGNAELADFLEALEATSGRDLGAWSRQWLETAGVTTLAPDLDVDADGRITRAAITQTAPAEHPTLRDHRLAIGLYESVDGRLQRRERGELDVGGASSEVPELVGRRRPDLLLLNDDDLTYAKVRLDAVSLETLTTRLSTLDSPLARALCWGAAWDMTRDAELPARRWVALVAAHAAREDEISVLQTLLGQARAAIERYSDPANRSTVRAVLADAARAALDAAAPGSDAQLVWARCLASVADRDADLAWVEGVYRGDVEVPGLAVDTDLRWHLLTCLAARGRADEDAIAAELERDPTDMGARHAAAARAARPSADAKAAAWAAVLDDESLPLAMRRAIMRGLQQPDQEDLLAPYVDRWVEALPRIWAEHDAEEALSLTSGLYPSTIVDERVIAAADRALAGDLTAPARRTVLEARDGTARALRARGTDRAAGVT